MGLPSSDIVKIVFGGPVSPQDSWSVGIWCDVNGGSWSQSDLDTFTTGAANGFDTAIWSNATRAWKGSVATATKYTGAKSYLYSGGTLTLQSAHAVTAVPGTGGAAMPAYVACVASLRTSGFARSQRGRIYLPNNGLNCNTATLQFTKALQDATNIATFLSNMALAVYGKAAPPAVISRNGAGHVSHITHVVLDTIPDTQHGRQSKATPDSVWTAPV